MLNLLAKDFKLIFASGGAGKWRIVSSIINVLMTAVVVVLEVFIMSMVLEKLKRYLNAPIAFLSIALFIVSVLMILLTTAQAKKLFFKDEDVELLSKMPISNTQVITSKLIFLFFLHYFSEIVFVYPIIASYASVFYVGKWLYYVGIFYPVLAFPFECGLALLLVYPYKIVSDYLKKHTIAQMIVAVIVLAALCLIYSEVLGIFVKLVASNNMVSLFSASSIERMISAKKFLMPAAWLVDIMFLGSWASFQPYISVSLGVLLLGSTVCILSFNFLRSIRFNPKAKKADRELKTYSVKKALVKKELAILFKDSNNLFSFTGLLLIQPFLIYLVVSSMNTIFTSGMFAYYIAVLPNFLPIIDILLVLLISLTISQGANNYISAENKNIRLIKTIPVGIRTQLTIKVGIPVSFVLASTLVSLLVLLIAKLIGFETFAFGFLMCALIHGVIAIVSMFEELNVRRNNPRNYFASSILSYIVPIVYSVGVIMLSFFGLSLYLAYLTGIVFIFGCGLPWIVRFHQIERKFSELEVVN